jgi:ribosomal protein S18 acetylase RimI-like enzyme
MRQRVLRPHQTIDEMVYDGDTSSDTFHLAAMDPTGQVLGIASYYHDPHPLTPSPSDWRLRGMAVEPALQGKGLGSILIQAGIKHIREQGGQRLWCNARVSAQGFYEKLGFTAEGDVFENVPIGPHYVMSIAVG